VKAPQQIVVTDWFRLLCDMVQREHSMSEIARKTGINVMTIYGYRDGSQPPHWRGELLIELWCAVCDRARVDVPTTELVLAPRVVHPAPHVQPTDDAMDDLSRIARAWRAGA